VNTGFTVTNIDGNWVAKTGTNATTVVFDVTAQPVGTTPQTITVGTIARLGVLKNIFRVNGGNGYITKVRLMTNLATFLDQIRVHFYSQPVTAIDDHAVFTLLWANVAVRLGYVDLPALATEAAGSDASGVVATPNDSGSKIPLFVQNAEAVPSKDLFYRLETNGTGTPASGQVFTIEATIDAN